MTNNRPLVHVAALEEALTETDMYKYKYKYKYRVLISFHEHLRVANKLIRLLRESATGYLANRVLQGGLKKTLS